MDKAIRNALESAMLLDYFEKLPPSHRKEYIGWIQAAKKEETQQKRIAKMIEMLKAKQV